MTGITVRDPFDVAQPQREVPLRPLQRLDLTLLIDGQDERLVRGIEVEANHVAHFLDKEGVRREDEALGPVRLDAEEGEVALDRALADARLGCHRAHAPVRGIHRFGLEHGAEEARNLVIVMRARPTRARRIVEACQAIALESPAPVAHHWMAEANPLRDRRVRQPISGQQNGLCPLHQRVRQRPRCGPFLQLAALDINRRAVLGSGLRRGNPLLSHPGIQRSNPAGALCLVGAFRSGKRHSRARVHWAI